jgi:2-keto-4-pentenoate hydratase/2-oxohepta-3-ene-1,7-dioic acid hydratase in catechol pathway
MKLARCDDGTTTFWAVVDPGIDSARAVAGPLRDWAPALTAGRLDSIPWAAPTRPLHELRLLAPVEPTSRVMAAGGTYAKHVAGLGLDMPDKPAAFYKGYAALVGPYDEIAYPAITTALDYEVELVVVIGADVHDPTDSASAILGYTVGNDVSARDWQFGGALTGMDMFSAKVLDDSTPIGPWIVTRDEFGDDQPDLELTLHVDGELRQADRTSSLVWPVAELVRYVHARMAQRCGDVLFTGTPAGVGHEDGRYLEPGQEVEATIEAIGTLRNIVGARKAVI